METRKILTILALGLAVWPAAMAFGGQSLTVNEGALDSIILKLGQTCTVEVVSDDASPYDAYVGFDDGAVLGTFSHVETMPEAGDLNDVTEYDVPAFYGYYVEAAGAAPPPSAGVHFVFDYQVGQLGETDLKLYDQTLTSVIDSVHITVVASEMGAAFTYQGRLLDANEAADGLYDFLFALYDAPSDGNQFGIVTDTNEVIVIDGYFTVELDFGSSVSDDNAVWLEIGVRPGAESDPCEYTILEPRQELTSVPYALHTRWLQVDTGLNNVFLGEEAGASNTTGFQNSAMGISALYSNTTGNYNSAMGNYALHDNTEGNDNSAMGYAALYSNTTGIYNSAIGYDALRGNTTGYYNVGVGAQANYWNQEGSGNTIIGYQAGKGATNDRSGNVFLGYRAGYTETGSNKLYIANSEVDPPLMYGEFDTGSVGIGTNSPMCKLDVRDGDIGLLNNDGTKGFRLQLRSDGDFGEGGFPDFNIRIFRTNRNAFTIDEDTGNVGIGYVNPGTARLAIYGNVGIGTTNPTAKLHIGGTAGVDGIKFPDGTLQTTAALGGGGDITAVNAGTGLTGGGASGDVTLEVSVPLELSGSDSGAIISGTNSGSGYGLYGEAAGNTDGAVYGLATGSSGQGVYGYASNSGDYTNYGGYFEALGSTGRGVYGYASYNSGNYENFGGYFKAEGYDGKGVYGEATGACWHGRPR